MALLDRVLAVLAMSAGVGCAADWGAPSPDLGDCCTDSTPTDVGWFRIGGAGDSVVGGLSRDGSRVAFTSTAADLVPADGNGAADVFVADIDPQTGAVAVHRVSVDSSGNEATGPSNHNEAAGWTGDAGISADGARVTFASWADDLVTGDQNRAPDVFVHDLATGETARANVSSDGDESREEEGPIAALSGDGRTITFTSSSRALVDDGGCGGAYLRDLVTGETRRVSETGSGRGCTYWGSGEAAISADGAAVAFTYRGRDIDDGLTGDSIQVFVRDMAGGGPAELVSRGMGGGAPDQPATSPQLSGDGQVVAFWSPASDLVPGDTNDAGDIFVRDRASGATDRVSVARDGSQADGESWSPSISADGRFVVFVSSAGNLVAGDDDGLDDAFVHDRWTGETVRVSVTLGGGEPDGATVAAAVSGDGHVIGFSSSAGNLLPGDQNRAVDVFLVPNPMAD